MVKKIVLILVLLILPLSESISGSGPDFREGEWEFTVKVEMPSMGMKMPPSTYTQCMKKDNPVPQNNQPGQACRVSDMKTKGNTVTWTMVCSNPAGKMTGKGKVTYQKESMSGTMTMEGPGMQMISKFSGHRLGPCK
jgi:hypothetical protein